LYLPIDGEYVGAVGGEYVVGTTDGLDEVHVRTGDGTTDGLEVLTVGNIEGPDGEYV